jgi:hypothetical protein
VSTDPAFSVADDVPVTVPAGGSADVEVQFTPTTAGDCTGTLYVRSVNSTELVAQVVGVKGSGLEPTPVVDLAVDEFALGKVKPNPSSGAVQIAFAVPREGRVRLRVLDIQGRVVALLADGVRAPGRYQGVWDGRRAQGGVAAGLYFVHFEAGGKSLVRRFALTR